jgi:hypothetical protein
MKHPAVSYPAHAACLVAALALAFLLAGSSPVQAGGGKPRKELSYHPFILDGDGQADPAALAALVDTVRGEVGGGQTQVVVMVHGFNQRLGYATVDYDSIARRLRRQADSVGLKVSIIGVHWDSYAGPLTWIGKAVGYRFTSLLGLRKVVKNPYLEKVALGRQVGRVGLRSLLFRLQDEFPKVPVNVLAHSLGAELIVSALCPESGRSGPREPSTALPERTLTLGMVALVGADLDVDSFCRRQDEGTGVRPALRRAQVWWVTVPEKDRADGMLEIRRGAGRGEAVGNRGLKLTREDLDFLLTRRALVLDEGDVPAVHRITGYYNNRRLKAIAQSLLYLQQPSAPGAQGSVLAALDGVLKADPETLETAAKCGPASVRLYASWRQHPATADFGPVAIGELKETATRPGRRAAPGAPDAVMSTR